MRIIKKLVLLTFTLLLIENIPAYAETYHWTDKSGIMHFTDDPASIPKEEKKKTKITERKANSWVMIEENISGYIYKSFGFYDEANIQKRANYTIVPVKVVMDNSRLGNAGMKSYLKITYQIDCTTMEVLVPENKVVNTTVNQFPAEYRRHPLGVTDHETNIAKHLLTIMCGKTPATNENLDSDD